MPTKDASHDAEHLRRAVTLARRGDTSPEPPVAAVLALGTRVVEEAFLAAAGGTDPALAVLEAAGEKALGKTLYLTLEPGARGEDGAAVVEKIAQAGVHRVVIGARRLLLPDAPDSAARDARSRLEAARVEVKILEPLADEEPSEDDEVATTDDVPEAIRLATEDLQLLIAPWRKYHRDGAAYVALKLALSLDGRIATRTGKSRWITCEEARMRVHALRARHDAVLVGINTVLADDPLLTVREVTGRSPARVVVDSKLRIPLDARLVATAEATPTCVITTADASHDTGRELEGRGVAVIRVPATAEGRCDMRVALRELAAREVVSVLCEGGAEMAGSLLANALADELHAFIAPMLLGPRGRAGAVDWAGPDAPSGAPRIRAPHWELCGRDAYVWGPMMYPKRKRATP